MFFFFSSRRRHTRYWRDWSSDVCSSDLEVGKENFNKTGSNINLLESILRQATTQGQIVILCTNLPLKGEGGLYEQYGASIKSLIAGNYVKLEFTGNDYRPFVTKQKKAMELLR